MVDRYSVKWYKTTKEKDMDNHCLDVTKPQQAYMYGFIQTDGHMSKGTRDQGRVTIEVGEQDRSVLETFASLISYHSSISVRLCLESLVGRKEPLLKRKDTSIKEWRLVEVYYALCV